MDSVPKTLSAFAIWLLMAVVHFIKTPSVSFTKNEKRNEKEGSVSENLLRNLAAIVSNDQIDFKNVDLIKETDRLETLQFWPCANNLANDTGNLAGIAAENGFYYNGFDDSITCYFCNLTLNLWQNSFNIKTKHANWWSQCPLLLKLQTGNVPITDEYGLIESVEFPPTNIRYITESSRLESFEHWPKIMKQKPEDLAKAGFYYSKTGDQVICFYCNGGLKDWEECDVPWEQHALWFDRCPFLIKNKGIHFIKAVQKKLLKSPAEAVPEMSKERNENENSLSSNGDTRKSVNSNLRQCRICYENMGNVCLIPCGHAATCSRCIVSLSSCPLCRKPYDKLVKIPFAQANSAQANIS